ncbi:MAG: HDOD domain-containing protein [bacterium]|nr:HDOD domain-containing protein [bacterium]MCP5068451.1 HDOD domain-containing protein [bacterium]
MQCISKKKLDRAVRELAPLSESARELVRLTSDSEYATAEIVKVVERDASLTVRLLRIANSPVLAPPAPIESVQHAASILGERTVVAAALSIGANWMQAPLSGYGPEAMIFENGLKTAIAARLVAIRVGCEELAPLAYTGGLLHDIGKVVLSEFLESSLQDVIQDVALGTATDWLAAEKEELGVTHCEVGAQVADQFGLGPALRAVIEHHHVPGNAESDHRPLVEIVHVADAVRAMIGGDGSADALAYPMDSALLGRLGIGLSELSEIVCDTLEESGSTLEAVSSAASG